MSQFNNSNTALSAFQAMFAEGQVRALPVDSDCMEPTIYKGEFAGVKPLHAYECEGVYALNFGDCIAIRRAQFHGPKGVHIFCDKQVYGDGDWLTMEDFNSYVVGRVVAVCGHVDRQRNADNRYRFGRAA